MYNKLLENKIALIVSIIVLLIISINIFKEKKEITIHGDITYGESFTIESYYKAKREIPFICSGFSFNGKYQKGKSFDYVPEINGNKYTITIPLDEIGWSLCNYQFTDIRIPHNNQNPQFLFKQEDKLKYVGYDTTYLLSNIQLLMPKLITHDKNDYTIDLHLENDKRNIYKTNNHLKTIVQVFRTYKDIYGKFPNKQKAQALIYKDSSSIYHKDKKLKRYIGYVHNYSLKDKKPVDSWGNHYEYIETAQNDIVSVYSLGRDGIISGDDIKLDLNTNLVFPRKKINAVRPQMRLIGKIFKAYDKVNNHIPDKNKAKSLFRLEGNLKAYSNEIDLDRYLKKTKREITYKNGDPLDPWGNPYQYMPESVNKTKYGTTPNKAMIYSFGPDGVKSKDDIHHWDIYSQPWDIHNNRDKILKFRK
jgi:hypothetical protein